MEWGSLAELRQEHIMSAFEGLKHQRLDWVLSRSHRDQMALAATSLNPLLRYPTHIYAHLQVYYIPCRIPHTPVTYTSTTGKSQGQCTDTV